MNRILPVLFLLSLWGWSSCKSPEGTDAKNNSGKGGLDALNASIAKDPDNDSLYFDRAGYWMEQSAFDSAIADMTKALSLDSATRPDYYRMLADAYLMNVQPREAVSTMNKALQLFPNDLATMLKLAEVHLILKQHMAALASLDKVFMRDPQNAQAYYLAGHVFYEMGDTGRAVNAYQKAVDLEPEFRKAWIQLGDVLSELKNPRAIAYYDNAILMDSLDEVVLEKKAYALYSLGKNAEAIALYQKICVRFPNYEPAFYNLGFLYKQI
ncbi:MAG TPA: tetratricopeptide repeat protein, partial [Saprospiraceae bacterium]|nr:tetratricopeptide repeat protein [Saprospiraceae bacterium]